MGKLDKEQEARMAGMAYALGIAEKKGIAKALEKRGFEDSKKHMIINPCAWYLWISTQNIL